MSKAVEVKEIRKVDDDFYASYETIQSIMAYEWLPDQLGTVLEIGCSRGYFTAKLRDKAERVYGVDVNEELVDAAAAQYPDVDFRTLDANDPLPFSDQMFDAVVMLEVYEHVDERRRLIDEVARVLKPGGILILSTPNTGLFAFMDSYNLKMRFQRTIPGLVRFVVSHFQKYRNVQYTDNLSWHPHFSLEDLRRSLDDSFQIRRHHRGGLMLFPGFAILRSVLIRTVPSRSAFRFCVKCMNLDSRISYGPCGYNLQVYAIRKGTDSSVP